MSLQENIKKKIFVPPLNHSGGGHFGCPPLNCSGGGQSSGGGTVPPPEIAQGGDSPLFPPLYPLLCMYISYIQGRIQDLAQGGGTNRARRARKLFCPPLSSSRGGGHFGCPPPELLRRGTILRGGRSPPLKLLRRGTVPYSPPCIRSCVQFIILIFLLHVLFI